MPRPVRWLDEIGDDELALVGGKALNLARLRRAGLEVPRGFVIGADSLFGGITPEARTCLFRFFRELGGGAVAVRSSANFEDSAAASFAGQGRSVLNVRTEKELLDAVGAVASSMEAPAARAYAERVGVAKEKTAVNLVVQEMVEADVAGVLFTSNPVSGSGDEMVVNATWGLGEPLVSGKVTPDQAVLDKTTGRCKSYAVGEKEVTLTSSGLEETDPERAEARCLDGEIIRQLAETGRRIEQHFGSPQDIEWAWCGRLYVLQTRPLTTAAADVGVRALLRKEIDRLRSLPGARKKVWASTGMAELLPCPTPLSWEVASRLMSGVEGYGLAMRQIGYDPAPGSTLERIAGHIYVDLDRESRMFFRHAPIGYALDEIREKPLRVAVPRQVLDWRKARPGLVVRWPGLLFGVVRLLLRLRRLRREFLPFFEDSFLPGFREYVRGKRKADLAALGEKELADEFDRRLEHFLGKSAPVLMTGSILAAMSYRELEDLLIDRIGREGAELTQQLTSGLVPNPTLDMHRAMSRLARGRVSEEEFLERFGHRCGSEFELAVPRWREDVDSLRKQVEQSRATQVQDNPLARTGRARTDAEEKLAHIGKRLGVLGREMVQHRLALAKKIFPLRERTKDYLMMEYELLRVPLVELDRRLGLDGGVFYLGTDEIREAAEGCGELITDLNEKIDGRRREHEEFREFRMPQVILGEGLEDLVESDTEVAEGHLNGIGVSSGVARGRVRVVRTAEGLSAVQGGEIVVVPSLDPTWTVAFARAGALVAERGAILSHGAILSREFGLPAVVNVPQATSRLRDGQEVRVDGGGGTVTFLDESDHI